MIRNLLAKVEAQDAKIANLEALHDAKIAVYDAKIANLEALLLGAPRVPQGKKNLRRRGLREDDATVDFATLMDFSTTEEKTEDMIALHGLAHVLKSLSSKWQKWILFSTVFRMTRFHKRVPSAVMIRIP